PARVIWAAPDRDVELPCDLTPPSIHDSVKLVLWFKDSEGIPLYSLDSRNGGSLKAATHSALAGIRGERMFFTVAENPKDAKLRIRSVQEADGGIYRCRVDYFNSPTRNFRVNLTLVENPDEPRIFDAQGKEVTSVAGPFREGHELFLSCSVTGGRPPPKVTWWRDNIEMISSVSHPSADGASAVVNQLFIGTVTRDFYGTRLECRAQVKPIKVKIVTPNELLTAGRPTPIRCETWGSYPPAKVTWLMDGEAIRQADVTVNNEGAEANLTSSILTLRVSAENDGAELTCRSTNPWFSNGALEDKRRINPPTVSVHLANEDPSRNITRSEGENVTLKCRADARPPVTAFGWFKNGMRMTGENTETLHLTMLERESGGSYACAASNTEVSPRCKPGTEQMSVGALNMHSMQVKCEVEADPADSVKFHWTYNNTRNVSPVLNSRISSHGLLSAVTYLPQSDSDIVTLACWAMNSVGRQSLPCLVHILPARIPEPPRLCELRNDSNLEVVCQPGNDGGLQQHFVLEALGATSMYFNNLDSTRSTHEILDNEISTMNDQATLAPLVTIQENVPQFKIPPLEPGREYHFQVYAVNAKGRSDPPYIIERVRVGSLLSPYDETIISEDPTPAETSNQKNRKIVQQQQHQQSQMIILAALVLAAGIIITSIIVAGCVAICRTRRPKPPEPEEVRKRIRPARNDVPSMYAEDDTEDEYTRHPTDTRCSRASTIRSTRYVSEGFVQYSQPSLNDPDLILPRGSDIEFTNLNIGGA
ncbi:CLUMA_CG020768, isoform A, partial [Clunio marinus]